MRRIAFINYEDVVGRRFNGFEYALHAMRNGLAECDMFVAEKACQDRFVHEVWSGPGRHVRALTRRLERFLRVQNMLFPPALALRKAVRKADLLHAQLVSGDYLSLWELALLSRNKPMVLQLHEFSPFTAGCSHPAAGCEQWITGCASCGDTNGIFNAHKLRTRFMWNYKNRVWNSSRMDIVVASRWLLEHVERSPMFTHCKKHIIPFGADLEVFKPLDKSICKREHGIPADHLVLFVRALQSPYKNLSILKRVLQELEFNIPVTLLTINGVGVFSELSHKYNIVEYEFIYDDKTLVSLFNAADIFLMPSRRETFGMMAMEALACGVPALVSQGTPLPEVACVPDAGMAFPQDDVAAWKEGIARLAADPEMRMRMGVAGRSLALKKYDINGYFSALTDLYEELITARAG